jgi:cellulose synthase/poly-beta-1,6-N-acetylglucosamine synthase-like glycosyltransferase
MRHTLLSVIIPAYNESARIGATLSDLKRYFIKKDISYEIIVVNDGSKDDTADVVRAFAKNFPGLTLIDNKMNRGKGYAVKCGMLAASGAYRLFMDADNSVTIDAIEPFIEEMYRGGHDIIIGSIAFRYMPSIEHNGWHRRFFGSISKSLVRIVATPGIHDTQRGFKLFTSKAADIVFSRQQMERFGFDIELIAIAQLHGLSIKELPVYWNNPAGSTVHLKAYLDSFIELGRIYRNIVIGTYDAPRTRGSRRRKASEAVLFLAEFPALLGRLIRELLSSKIDLEIMSFDADTERKKGKGLVYNGKEYVHYSSLGHQETALYTLVKAQKFAFFLFVVALVSAFMIDPRTTTITLVSIAGLIYILELLFHSYLFARTLREKPAIKSNETRLSDAELPVYTILCPLYREWHITPQFLAALENIDYPAEKLDVILLLEEKDVRTRRVVEKMLLPDNFRKLIVPDSEPRTKARAMNYGLERAKGEYLVVYGSGDIPEPDQLKKALATFRKAGPKTISVQAKIGFHNPDESVLTSIFAAEHSLWFDLTLPGLQSLRAPMPLGGTSNHFKVEHLKILGGWDAFNASEDWDLGIRLSKNGYRSAVFESTTLEEANPSIHNWYEQRSRWVKGYIQTYLVHMRDPQAFKGGAKDLLAFQVVVGAKIFALMANPAFWLIALGYLLTKMHTGISLERIFPPVALAIGALTFALGNCLYLISHLIACTKKTLHRFAGYAFLVPLYRLGMSLSAWKAAFELAINRRSKEKMRLKRGTLKRAASAKASISISDKPQDKEANKTQPAFLDIL